MRSSGWQWLAVAGGLLVGGCLGSNEGARCQGTLVSDGSVCVVAHPISETGFDCPPMMPFEYFGEGWALCSDQALDDFQQGQAVDEANLPGFPDQPNQPGPQDPDRPNEPGPTDPEEPTEPDPCTVDVDGDGIIDCDDPCVDDAANSCEPTEPGEPTEPTEPTDCEVDVDADGIIDCQDTCLDRDGVDVNGDGLICSDGDFLDDCSNNSDCASGWCVESPDGYVCTTECLDECPSGFGCSRVENSSGDIVFLCLPQ